MTKATVEVEGTVGGHTFTISPPNTTEKQLTLNTDTKPLFWFTQFGLVAARHDEEIAGNVHIFINGEDHVVSPGQEETIMKDTGLHVFVRHDKQTP